MTTYNTGNPLGSAAPKDLYDNAENLDTALHTGENTWVDRFGNTRTSWAGATGYQILGDYAGGIEITERNQIVREGGEYWRLKGSVDLPYTTTGTWVGDDENRFVSVGDAALRQELAADGGAFLVKDAVASVANVTELRALTGLVDGAAVFVADDGSGGAATYTINSGSESEDLPYIVELDSGQRATSEKSRANNLLQFTNAEEMRAQKGRRDKQIAFLSGYDEDSQSVRSQRFYWDSASTEADNGRTVFAVSGVATGRWLSGENTQDSTSKALNRTRGFGSRDNPWGIKGVNILGDSISHGADSTDIPNNSWVGIFRKMLQIEYGGTHYGFCSFLDYLGVGTGEYHSVTRSGWSPQTQENASHTMNGRGYSANTPGSTIDVVVPTGEKMFAVWYSGGSTGVIDVKVNGASVGTIDTSVGPYGIARSDTFDIVDNGFGKCDITLELSSGEATVCGMSYLDSEKTFQVNNFSDSGRRGRVPDEAVIEAACQGCQFLVWALGTNDDNFSAGSPEIAQFRQRMDWLVQYATANDTKMYFLELNFRQYNDNAVRAEIRRAVSMIPSAELVSMPDLLKIGNRTAQLAALGSGGSGFLYDDATHPSDMGHKVIAETLAQRCGLSVTSKRQAEMLHGKWVPIDLAAGGFENTFTDSNRVSAYKQVGTDWLVRLWIGTPSAKDGDTIATLPFASSVTRYVAGTFSALTANKNEVQVQSGTPSTTLLYREVAGTPPTYANEFVIGGRRHETFGPYQ